MTGWHKLNLISLNNATKKYAGLEFRHLLNAIHEGDHPLYYLVPPRRYASKDPTHKLPLTINLGGADYEGRSVHQLFIWDDAFNNCYDGPTAFPIDNAKELAEIAMYALLSGNISNALQTPFQKTSLRLRDKENILRPSRWPLDPSAPEECDLSSEYLISIMQEQLPDEEPPLFFRELDDDYIQFGDFLVPEHLLIASNTRDQISTAQEKADPGPTERQSLLNTIWALKELILSKCRTNQSGIIMELLENYSDLRGISKSKLGEVFAEANKRNANRVKESIER